MTTGDAAVDVPYCRICRRSSELKWRKHVFSKSHQRAAVELLAARVAKVAEVRAQIADASSPNEQLRSGAYCVFCEVTTETKRLWIEHYASPEHCTKLNEFCRHHRCDATQQIRPQLCLTGRDAQQLAKVLDDKQSALMRQTRATTTGPQNVTSEAPSVNQPSEVRAEAFLESAASRLSQVSALRTCSVRTKTVDPVTTAATSEEKVSWMGPHANAFVRTRTVTSADGIQQNPLGRHEGKRVWGGGIVKVKKSDWVPWGIDLLVAAEQDRGLGNMTPATLTDDANSFQHRRTDSAFGAGLASIKRIEWGDSVANIHSAAIPPWMVDTEDEYKRCNERATERPVTSLSTSNADSKPMASQMSSSSATSGIDIFSKLERKYDEKTWLPNFGGVWQEGSRLKTQRAFRTSLGKERARTDHKLSPPQVEFRALRTAISSSICDNLESSGALFHANPPSVPPSASTVAPVESQCLEEGSVTSTDQDAKKTLLLAQKERLRAKIAARRQPKT